MMVADRQSNRRGWRILIAGTGGQGVLTAASLLCECFAERGHDVVSGQLHGMAQRGGAVQSSVIIDGGISPRIADGRADVVLGFEPVETVRALPFMSLQTTVYMNTAPVIPFVLALQAAFEKNGGEYPNIGELTGAVRRATGRLLELDATSCAAEAGSGKSLNMVMLGCLLGSDLLPCTADDFADFLAGRLPRTLVEMNLRAFRRGVEVARETSIRGGVG